MAHPIVDAERQLQRRDARMSERRQASSHPARFLLPAFAVLGVFFFLPTVFNFIYAFTDWSAFKSDINFVGFENFASLLGDGSLFTALRVTLIYAALVGIMQNVFGLGLALLFERDTRVNRFARVIFFIPVLMSALAVGYIFQALLKPAGAVNEILALVSGQNVHIAWLGDTTWTLVVVAFVNSWKWMGLAMIIFLAGLKTIPEDVLEAARMDGASAWKTFLRVKFPLLAPAITFNFATALLGSLNGFDTVQATTAGGPAQTTEVLNIYIFQIFGYGLYAQATTMSLVLFFLVLVLAFPVVGYLRKRENVL